MAKGKLIIIESGSDASGKATQSNRLYERLINEGKQCMKITFPDYNSDSSALVKMYLNGDFGKDPNDVNPYVSSTFYAVDRYAFVVENMVMITILRDVKDDSIVTDKLSVINGLPSTDTL
mgnify:CR=1 FL=1